MATPVRTQPDTDAAIRQMVEIIAAGWDPAQIVLFGSRARGDHNENSDVDLLVILDEIEDYSRQRTEIERALDCTNTRRDVKLATPGDVVRKATVPGTIERAAMIEGKTLHIRGGGDPVNEAVTRWLAYARIDFRAARHWATADPTEPLLACYHAQQATEKTLKAALVAAGIDPPRTHDLNQLRDRVPEDWRIPGASDDLQLLTGWAAKSRYPNGLDEFTDDLAAQSIDIAQAIYDAATDELSQRGMAIE